jgi:hypothetical protein
MEQIHCWILPNSFLHTNFKLSSDGEKIILTSSQSTIVDQITFGGSGPLMFLMEDNLMEVVLGFYFQKQLQEIVI